MPDRTKQTYKLTEAEQWQIVRAYLAHPREPVIRIAQRWGLGASGSAVSAIVRRHGKPLRRCRRWGRAPSTTGC